MSKEKILAMQKQVTGKLMAAISMLLVSAILMCLTSYAWFILSTAPEVSNLKTTAGANGALEIALQSTNEAGNGRAEITSAVGSSHAVKSAAESNTYWGNVVDLTEGYGLDNIQLYPSRLKTKATTVNGKTSYTVDTGTILQVPQFGQDGRVTSLLNATKTHYNKDGQFVTGANWGVNVLGAVNPDNKAEDNTITLTYRRDTVLKQAREKVAAYRIDLRSDMTDLIARNSVGVVGLMAYAINNPIMSEEDMYYTVKDFVTSMDAMVTKAADAVRWALLANAAADEEHYKSDSDADMKALGDIYAGYAQMPLTGDNSVSVESIAKDNGYSEIERAAIAIDAASARVSMAKSEIDDENKKMGLAGLSLITPSETVMHGSKGEDGVEGVTSALPYDFANYVETDTIYTFAKAEDPADVNLFSSIAAVIGDYRGVIKAWISFEDDSVVGIEPDNLENWLRWEYTVQATSGRSYDAWKDVDDLASVEKQADGTYAENANVGTLGVVLNQIEGIEAPGVIQVEVKRPDVTAYGYSVDLAFQSSEATNLLLQQTGIGRVSGDGEDPDLLGGGSTVQFTVAGDMTAEQVKDLLQGVYIVFMNTGTGAIYKVAAVDPDSVVVKLLPYPATATATLALYEPAFDEAGNLSLGRKITEDEKVITAMSANEAYYISAVVYLNGDAVDTTAFSATQELSMTGAMNLQFASSVTLTPMVYSDYKKKD